MLLIRKFVIFALSVPFQTATCTVLNPSIARCHLPKIYDWGTKTVYFQPQSGGANDEKAFVGYIYFGNDFIWESQGLEF